MSIPISAFPITVKKSTELATVSTLSSGDLLLVYTSDLKTITYAQLLALFNFQTHSSNLDEVSAVNPSALGLNLLALEPPTSSPSFPRIDTLGGVLWYTPSQLVDYLRVNGGGVDQSTGQSLYNKVYNGIALAAGSALSPDGVVSIIDIPSDSYTLRLIKVGYTGGVINFRFTGSTDVTFPKSGVLAVVAGIRPDSDDTKASAATLNLDTSDAAQIDVTGAASITAIILAENVVKTIRFTGVTTLVNSANLVLPGGENIVTAAGDYAVVKGASGGVVNVVDYKGASSKAYSKSDFFIGGEFYIANSFVQHGGTYEAFGSVYIGQLFATSAEDYYFTSTGGAVNATFPAGTHTLLARDSYATTVTAAGTTVLTVASQYQQFFTGATTQTVTLPVANTLRLGFTFRIVNLSSGNVTVQSSGSNSVVVLSANTSAILTCILASGTSAASWSAV
jgi:hypothetical protein